MNEFPLLARLYYRAVGLVSSLTYWTDKKRVLGISIAFIIKLLLFLFLIAGLIGRWGAIPSIIILTVFLFIQFSYWRSRRRGYYRFISRRTPLNKQKPAKLLAKNERIPILATGVFSVLDYEKTLLFQPGKYWQAPLGDHGVIIEHKPGKFLYQFFRSATMENLRCGWLLHGLHPVPAVAISFLSTWGPEFHEMRFDILGRVKEKPPEKIREIYLSFASNADELTVWQNLSLAFKEKHAAGHSG